MLNYSFNSISFKGESSFMKMVLFSLFFLCLVMIFSTGTAHAADDGSMIYVNGSSGNDSNDGYSWLTAKQTIGSATGTVTSGGTVTIANGTYNGTGNTEITPDKDMTIIGESQNGTIINGGGTNQIFTISEGFNITLNNLTITNGKSENGGAIYNEGTLNLENCTFTQNSADYAGGAIMNCGTLTMTDSTFTGNSATNSEGTGYGGAIMNCGTLTVTDSTFTGNSADCGGAITNTDNMTVTDSTFTSNTAGQYGGGAITNAATANVNGSTFSGNTAGEYGGGAIYTTDTLDVNGSTFTGNTAGEYGGAIAYYDGTLTVTGSTFTGNTAGEYGGAIYNYKNDSIVHFSTFFNNTATTGIAIYCRSGTVNATLNWWGSNNDPSSKVYGDVDVNPWLILDIDASPVFIGKNDSSTVTANLCYDSDGNYHNPTEGHIIDGISVTFNTTIGNINTPISTSNGSAVSTLTAETVTGLADVSAVLDDQSVQTSVYIDATSPTVTAIDPEDNAVINDTSKVVTVTFSEAVQEGSAYDDISITCNGTPLTVVTSLNSNILTITNTETYTDGRYTVTIPTDAVIDTLGNGIDTYTSQFIVDTIPPVVIAVDPVDGAVINDTSQVVTVTFSKDILEGIAFDDISISCNGTALTTITKAINGNILTLTNTASYADGTYTANIPADAVVDEAGNGLETAFSSVFTMDTIAPVVTAVDPVDGAVINDTSQVVTVTFSKDILEGIAFDDISISCNGTALTTITKAINGNILTLTNTASYADGTYTANIPADAVVDEAGNGLETAFSSVFTMDTVAPTVISIVPATNAVINDANTVITVTFSELVREGTGWYVLLNSDMESIAFSADLNGNKLTITPDEALTDDSYSVFLSADCVTDLAGNPLDHYSSNFTVDTVAPVITSTDPVNGATNVAADKVITITFSEDIVMGTGWIELVDSSGTAVDFTSEISGNVLTITPTSDLSKSKYKVMIHTGSVTDLAGNILAGKSFTFSVGTSPTITATSPLDGATNVSVAKTITVTFSEAIRKSSHFWVELVDSTGTHVAFTTYITSGNILVIDPTADLAADTTYKVKLHTGCVTDLAGNPVAPYIFSFTTRNT